MAKRGVAVIVGLGLALSACAGLRDHKGFVIDQALADAIQVDEAARRRGTAVPEQLSIVVLGNHIRAAQTERRFTSFLIPREAMGRAATAMLVRRVENTEPIQQILLPCEPVEGDTLGPPSPKTKKTR